MSSETYCTICGKIIHDDRQPCRQCRARRAAAVFDIAAVITALCEQYRSATDEREVMEGDAD